MTPFGPSNDLMRIWAPPPESGEMMPMAWLPDEGPSHFSYSWSSSADSTNRDTGGLIAGYQELRFETQKKHNRKIRSNEHKSFSENHHHIVDFWPCSTHLVGVGHVRGVVLVMVELFVVACSFIIRKWQNSGGERGQEISLCKLASLQNFILQNKL